MVSALFLCLGCGVLVGLKGVLGLAIVAGVLLGVAVVRWPAQAVLLLMLWLPLEGWLLKFFSGASPLLVLPDVVCALVLISVILRLVLSRRLRDLFETPLVLYLGLTLAVVGCLSWLVNGGNTTDVLYWFRVSLRFVPLGVVMSVEPWRSQITSRLTVVAALGAGTQIVIGLLEWVGGSAVAQFFWPGQFSLGGVATQVDTLTTVGSKVVAGTMGHYNIYGLTMVMYVSVILGALCLSKDADSPVRRLPLLLVAVFGCLAIILSQSRQAIAILAVLLIALFGLFLWRGKRWQRWLAMAIPTIALIVLVVGAATFLDSSLGRFSDLFRSSFWQQDTSANRGYVVSEVAPALLKHSPFLGLGPGSFGGSSGTTMTGASELGLDLSRARFTGDVGWVSYLAQLGLMGVATLFVLVCFVFSRVVRLMSRPREGLIALGLFGVLLFGMMASTPLSYKPTGSLIWLLSGLILGALPLRSHDVISSEWRQGPDLRLRDSRHYEAG